MTHAGFSSGPLPAVFQLLGRSIPNRQKSLPSRILHSSGEAEQQIHCVNKYVCSASESSKCDGKTKQEREQRVLGVGVGVVLSFQSRSGWVMWKRQPGGMEHLKVVVNIRPGEKGIRDL